MAGIIRGIVGRFKVRRLNLKKELKSDHFRISIFGSARIKPGDQTYENVYDLAERIGTNGYDVITGGGPGLMDAANAGHMAGDKKDRANSIGLIIHLPYENKSNKHLEIRHRFKHFSKRLDTFLVLSHVIVVTTGGIGSLLELFYMWQHLQVLHVEYKPIILIGKMWQDLMIWMEKDLLSKNLVSLKDFDFIYIAKNNDHAMSLIDAFNKLHKKEGRLQKIACDQAFCEVIKKGVPIVKVTSKVARKTTAKKKSAVKKTVVKKAKSLRAKK